MELRVSTLRQMSHTIGRDINQKTNDYFVSSFFFFFFCCDWKCDPKISCFSLSTSSLDLSVSFVSELEVHGVDPSEVSRNLVSEAWKVKIAKIHIDELAWNVSVLYNLCIRQLQLQNTIIVWCSQCNNIVHSIIKLL